MTAFYRMRANTALKRKTTLFAVLVRFSAKEYRQPMRREHLLPNADALRWGWRHRTMRRDCWENAYIAKRYNLWTKCKRRVVCLGAPMHSDRRDLTLRRALQRPVDRTNTVYRTRPYRLRRFLRTAHTNQPTNSPGGHTMSTTAYDDQYAPEPTTPAPSPAEVYANLQAQVVQWARDRNLIEGSTLQAQACKLWEEFGELATGVNKGRLDLALDGIGDCLVVLTIMHELLAARTKPASDKQTAPHLAPRAPDELSSARHLLLRAAHSLASLPVCSPTFECWEIVFASYDLQRIAYKLGTTPEACLQTAWNEIKDRKGRMIDGVFVKEADLCKQPIG